MNRREALSAVSFLVGGTIIGAEAFLSCSSKPSIPAGSGILSIDHVAFLDEVAETILPTTASSPGAKEARVGEFMQIMLQDCYSPADQKIFMDGIIALNNAA